MVKPGDNFKIFFYNNTTHVFCEAECITEVRDDIAGNAISTNTLFQDGYDSLPDFAKGIIEHLMFETLSNFNKLDNVNVTIDQKNRSVYYMLLDGEQNISKSDFTTKIHEDLFNRKRALQRELNQVDDDIHKVDALESSFFTKENPDIIGPEEVEFDR